jgi:hypothetical protein
MHGRLLLKRNKSTVGGSETKEMTTKDTKRNRTIGVTPNQGLANNKVVAFVYCFTKSGSIG